MIEGRANTTGDVYCKAIVGRSCMVLGRMGLPRWGTGEAKSLRSNHGGLPARYSPLDKPQSTASSSSLAQ